MKRSVRDYLLTLCVAVVFFAVVAFFLLQAAEGLMGDVVQKIGSQAQEETGEEAVAVGGESTPEGGGSSASKEDETVTFLIMGEDFDGENADAIFLLGINATQKKATLALIPSNTIVPDGSNKFKLGALYSSKNMPYFKKFILQETGINADYYATVSMSGFANFVDFLGGVSYTVPENMYYFDPTQNLRINLKAGAQTLTGDQALQLMAYRGYKDGAVAREETQIDFAKACCEALLRPDLLSRAKAVMYSLYYNLETDFDESAMNALGEMIFHFDEYTLEAERIPGSVSGEFYLISTSRAKKLFEIYAK
ncbi:MAG: LCP family protein [Clostridia bacterium]|nr:LCP family protein [Clostridia bacterium]